MSATSEAGIAPVEQVVLVPAGGARGAASRERAPARERPGVRLAAFSALGFYGAVRWGSLLSPAPVLRLLGLLAVAVALAAIGQRVTSYRRVVIPVVSVLAVLLILPLAGIPVRWVTHLRIAVTADAIGSGLSAMPGALVPYDGVNEWLRWVIVIGGGLLLVAAGLILASAPKPLGEGRRAAAALLLVALAIVPSTIVRPSLPYLQGLILFVLVAGFMWGERLRGGEMLMATVLAVLAGAAGMIAAPRLDPHSPWLNYEALAGDLAPAASRGVRLAPELRPAALATDRARGARRPGPAPRLLEGGEPRRVRRPRLGSTRASRRRTRSTRSRPPRSRAGRRRFTSRSTRCGRRT